MDSFTERAAPVHDGTFVLPAWDRSNAAELSTDGNVAVNASDCVFWCAVAIGGLVQGRPTTSVSSRSEGERMRTRKPDYK